MKKTIYIIFITAATMLLGSCENELDGIYHGDQAVYFPNFTATADSISFSFLGNPNEMDTVFLAVKLLGHARPTAQKMALKVVPEKTTAVAGVHYQALPAFYEFPPNTFDFMLPIILIKHPDLDEGNKVLAVEIVDGDDLKLAYTNRANARVVFSNIAMKPAIWDATLAPWFGEYSRIKHIVCMELIGRPFPQTALEFNLERNFWRNWGWTCSNYFRDNIIMNTDVDPPTRILPWF
jgi:hypothetical protein